MADKDKKKRKKPASSLGPGDLRHYARSFRKTILLGLASLVLVFLSWNQFGRSLTNFSEFQSNQAELQKSRAKLAELEGLDANVLESANDVALTALPIEKPVFEILTSLDAVSEASEVTLIEVKTSPGRIATESSRLSSRSSSSRNKKTGPETLFVDISVKGGLFELNDFLLRLSEMVPLVDLETISISQSGVDEETGENNFSLTGRILVYFLPSVESKTSGVVSLSSSNQEILDQLAEFFDYSENF